MNNEYLKPKDVAEILSVNLLTVYRMIQTGRINAVLLPTHRYRIHKTEMEKILNNTNQYDGNRNPENQEDPRSGGCSIPNNGSTGGDTSGVELQNQKDDVPIQE